MIKESIQWPLLIDVLYNMHKVQLVLTRFHTETSVITVGHSGAEGTEATPPPGDLICIVFYLFVLIIVSSASLPEGFL